MDESNDPLVALLTFYEKTNYVLRIALLITVLWPFSVIGTAMALKPATAQTVVPIVDLVPLAAVFFLILGAPFGLLVLLRNPTARKGLTWLAGLIGVELTIGVYFSTIPVSKDIGLVPLLILTSLAILFLRIGGIAGVLTKTLALLIIGITCVFVFGGRKRVEQQIEKALNAPPHPVPIVEMPPHSAALKEASVKPRTRLSQPSQVAPESAMPAPITAGPVASTKDVDIYRFGFWPCRRVAAAVLCKGYIRNEFTKTAYQPLRLSDVKDDLGNEYTPQQFSDNGFDCLQGCSPELQPQGSHMFVLKVDGVVSRATSLNLSFHLSRSSLSESFTPSTTGDVSIIVPIQSVQ